jgi:hypothetical protein
VVRDRGSYATVCSTDRDTAVRLMEEHRDRVLAEGADWPKPSGIIFTMDPDA